MKDHNLETSYFKYSSLLCLNRFKQDLSTTEKTIAILKLVMLQVKVTVLCMQLPCSPSHSRLIMNDQFNLSIMQWMSI